MKIGTKRLIATLAGATLSFPAWANTGDTGQHNPETPETEPAVTVQNKPPSNPIGTAQMSADGTIMLTLEAPNPDGTKNYGVMVLPVDHPRYKEILQHVGELKPGDSIPVAPWPKKP